MSKRYNVEHGLIIYASSYVTISGEALYDDAALGLVPFINDCHLYMIGYVPEVRILIPFKNGMELVVPLSIKGEDFSVEIDVGVDFEIEHIDGGWILNISDGREGVPRPDYLLWLANKKYNNITFEVKYVGQAYGRGGERAAIERLRRHETLQKISLQKTPPGYVINMMLLDIDTHNTVMTVISPNGDDSSSDERFENGFDKLYGTSEVERVCIYEASLIRYFMPEFNKEFKNSFPSTNMKILSDCYEKDFLSVTAEICFDMMPYTIFTASVIPNYFHIAHFDLHSEPDRRFFFFDHKEG